MGIEGDVRLKGANDYKVADEIRWRGSLGAFLVEQKDFTVSVASECNGSSKGQDVFQDMRATDAAFAIVHLGPRLSAMWMQRYHADVGLEFPVLR